MSDSGPPDRPPAEPDQRAPVPLPSRYRFEETLGEGGLGTVVKAYDTQLRTHVAIKTIRHDLRERNREQYDHLRDRFEHEAIAGARVRDSHYVVTVHDLVIDDTGDAFLILAFAPSGTLHHRLREGPLPLADALRLTADAARGLRDLHAADLVHRDIKPENIFLAADGRAMIGDLGIVQMSTTTFRTRLAYGSAHGHPGTPLYMSPEQETSTGFLTPESDQYSLGAVLFELLTGQRYKQIYDDEREALLASLPSDVAALIRTMTADRAADRYRGMGALVTAIEQIDQTSTPQIIPAPRPETATIPATVRRETPPTNVQPAVPVATHPARSISRRVVLAGIGTVAVGGAATGAWVLGHRGSSVQATIIPPSATRIPATATGVPATATARPSVATAAGVPLQGHRYRVKTVAFSPDGQTLASGSFDNTVRLWRVADGGLIREISGHTDGVNGVAFSPDGHALASVSSDRTVQLWSVADGSLIRTLQGHTGAVLDVAFSPDGKILASGARDTTIRLWRVADGSIIQVLEEEGFLRSDVLSVAFAPDGQTLASATADTDIHLWRVTDGSAGRRIKNTDLAYSITFSPDGQLLASGERNLTVRLLRVVDGSELRTLQGHTLYVYSVAFSPDGQTLASGSADTTVRLWRVADGSPLRTLQGHNDRVTSVAFSPDGQTLASGSEDNTVRLWRL